MSMTTDSAFVQSFLDRVAQRVRVIDAAKGAAIGLFIGALRVLFLQLLDSVPTRTALATLLLPTLVGGAIGLLLAARRASAAVLVERRSVSCNNLVITAQQLIRVEATSTAPSPIAPIVFRQAADAIRKLDVAELFPARAAVAMLGASMALVIALYFMPPTYADYLTDRSNARGTTLSIDHVDVTVVSPSYVNRADKTSRDPTRVEALAGSHVKLTVASAAAVLNVETLQGKQSLTQSSAGKFTADIIADADGFIAVQPASASGTIGTRKLIGLSVTPDRAPHVRITAPAKDMMFPDSKHSLDLVIEADDDIALASLKLRYTQVTGSGERYTFKEGEVPLQVTRTSDGAWGAKVHWNLETLGLDAGDMVVYRAAATDKRPGATAAESDSYIAEILLPGSDAAAGFSIDPDQERYALSQQMIIVKTERLVAKRASMATEKFADDANDIAVEQRRVRAEFVFMMGGELADEPLPDEDMTTLHEEAEAEGESDILAGRGANQGRVALQLAIRSMSSAATLLNTANVDDALTRERAALKQLERAFSHTRIILRALTEAEKLDLTRRMTGPLLDAGRDIRPSAAPEAAVRLVSLRNVLAGVASLSGNAASDASVQASNLAEQVLRVGPSEKPLQEISAQLNEVAVAFSKHNANDARRSLELATVRLTGIIRAELVPAPSRDTNLETDRLNGALNDLARPPRGSR